MFSRLRRSWLADKRGMAALEFAFLAPALLSLAFGVIIYSIYFMAALGVRNADGRYDVRVLDAKGKAVARTVKTGINNNVKVQLLDGLAEGDTVVIGDATPAVAGS